MLNTWYIIFEALSTICLGCAIVAMLMLIRNVDKRIGLLRAEVVTMIYFNHQLSRIATILNSHALRLTKLEKSDDHE